MFQDRNCRLKFGRQLDLVLQKLQGEIKVNEFDRCVKLIAAMFAAVKNSW